MDDMTVNIVERACADRLCEFSDRIDPLLQRIFKMRNVSGDRELDYSLARLTPFHQMKGIKAAALLLADGIAEQKKMVVVGDFDCDGATSSALSVSALKAMGATTVSFITPNRFDYGYGLSTKIVKEVLKNKPDILITVDNGIASHSGVALAREQGVAVLITDHHLPPDTLPEANVIVNPNQQGCSFPWKSTAGVGVIFYVMCALRAELRRRDKAVLLPSMAQYLDLVALGTVADVVPLDYNNRILIYQGIERIKSGVTRPGICALIEVAGKQQSLLSASDLGFSLGPRLNAAGRLDDMSIGIKLLLSEHIDDARRIAEQLDQLNKLRRQIEMAMQEESKVELQALKTDSLFSESTHSLPWGICLYKDNWHQGVIGILASRIKEQTGRPVIAFAKDCETEKGLVIKGSARSIANFHMRDALSFIDSQHPNLLIKFGGHAMAAGMSLYYHDYPKFCDYFDQYVRNTLTEEALQITFHTDGSLTESQFTLEMVSMLKTAGPWGQNFPEPLFDGLFEIRQRKVLRGGHLKLQLALPNKMLLMDGLLFNSGLPQYHLPAETTQIRCLYRLERNFFRGRFKLQLIIEHFEPR